MNYKAEFIRSKGVMRQISLTESEIGRFSIDCYCDYFNDNFNIIINFRVENEKNAKELMNIFAKMTLAGETEAEIREVFGEAG